MTVKQCLIITFCATFAVAHAAEEAAADEIGPPNPRTAWADTDRRETDSSGESVDPFKPDRGRSPERVLDIDVPFTYEQATSLDASLVLSGLMIATAPSLIEYEVGLGSGVSKLDPSRLNPLDRTVIGNRSKIGATSSDVLLSTAIILPHIVGFIDALAGAGGEPGRWSEMLENSWMLAETLSATFLVTNLVKFMLRRPRPYAYDPRIGDEDRGAAEASLSFFSGHTAIAFSMATAYSYMFTKQNRGSPLSALVWTGSHLLAGSTAVLRVLAGKHFWSDVLVGAAVGSAMGFAVPALHDAVENGAFPKVLANLRFLPVFHRGGFGVTAVLAF